MFGIGEGPFHSAEKKMHQDMMSAEGSSVDETWVRKMIAHHEGGIEMSEIVLQQGTDPEVQRKARETIEEQRKDIEELNRILTQRQAA